MDSEQLSPGVGESPFKLEHTLTGKPYILLKTSSPSPVYLTEFYTTDTKAIQATLSIPSVHLNLISVPQPYTLADAEWWINLQLSGNSNLPLQVLRSGSPDEKGIFIGSVSLMPADSEAFLAIKDKIALEKKGPGEHEYELGYYLHPDWQGKGIMRNAARALVWWGKGKGVEIVMVRVLEGNLASRRVIESLKEFVREEKDDWVDWPEVKGGGRRKILVWRWKM